MPEQLARQPARVLFVGRCVSKDVAARLKNAGYRIMRAAHPSAGMSATHVLHFDFALIDTDGFSYEEISEFIACGRERGLGILVLLPPKADREPAYQLPGTYLEKPVGFDAVVAAMGHTADGVAV